jgi:predicted dehydrogenase
MKVAIVGCGSIGQKRAKVLPANSLLCCVDTREEKARSLAALHPGCMPLSDWHGVISRQDVKIVLIATTHQVLAEITMAAIQSGKHVLVEKPAALSSTQLEPVIAAARQAGGCVHVGFNHRYHRALCKAREVVDAGVLGPLMFVRGRYGHGGRAGYEREWRAQPHLSGGGELIDQGVHLIDLARWFLGDFTSVQGFAHTYFWDMPVEDNGFMLLKTPRQQVALLHASCTEWKNLFSLEIYGQKGKLEINGLGGSYGVERLTHYQMLPQMGPPETTTWEYLMDDNSWEVEFAEFLEDIRLHRKSSPGLEDAKAALEIVEAVYAQSRA